MANMNTSIIIIIAVGLQPATGKEYEVAFLF